MAAFGNNGRLQDLIALVHLVPFQSLLLHLFLQTVPLLFLQSHHAHVSLFGCILYADVVVIVLKCILKGWAFKDLALHNDV